MRQGRETGVEARPGRHTVLPENRCSQVLPVNQPRNLEKGCAAENKRWSPFGIA